MVSKRSRCLVSATAVALICNIGSATARDRVAKADMPRYCQGEAAAEYNVSPRDISTLPVEHDDGSFVVYGQTPAEGSNALFFVCSFNENRRYMGVHINSDSRQKSGDDSDDAAAAAAVLVGAALLLGVAEMSHDDHHHCDGRHHSSDSAEARYERGYRDGLHGEDYDSAHSSKAYGNGYDASVKERRNRLAHKHRQESEGLAAPPLATRGCVGEASGSWNINPRDIHVVKAEQRKPDLFKVEVAAGHKHGVCKVTSQGQVRKFRNGRF